MGELDDAPGPDDPEGQSDADLGTERLRAPQAEEEQECETCPQCAARDMGSDVTESIYGENEDARSRATKLRAADYQHYVCPWHDYRPEDNRIDGWKFSGVKFDGLHPEECHLFEVKHGYDGFLEQKNWMAGGGPQLRAWAEAAEVQVFNEMIDQGRRQHRAVSPHYGEVKLTWVFSHMITQLYVGRRLLDEVEGWYHEMEVRPWTNG